MSEHAPLAPSSAPQWGHCSGSVIAQSGRVKPDTEQTRNGTATHWVGEQVLTCLRSGFPNWCETLVGEPAPNGVVIDRKMADGAQVYVDDVLEVCDRFNAWDKLLLEHRVHMPQIHPDNWGTLDAGLYLPERRVLFLWDAKFGHREVSPRDNLQLIDYALGLVNHYGINGQDEQEITLVLRIVQPFAYHAQGPVREWAVPLSGLRAYWNQLQAKAVESFTNPTLTAGSWCRDCLAIDTCANARRYIYSGAEFADRPLDLETMAGRDKATELNLLRELQAVVKSRAEALEDDLKYRISQGETDSGLTLETTAGRLKYTVSEEQAIAFLAAFGIDAAVPAVKTPTQAIAMAPAELRPGLKAALNAITERPAGAAKLIPVNESRTAAAFQRRT